MSSPKHFSVADFGAEVAYIKNNKDKRLFRAVDVNWSPPKLWERDQDAPVSDADYAPANVYAITRHHHLEKRRENIVYVGMSLHLDKRFANHPKADLIRHLAGEIKLSVGTVTFGPWSHKKSIKKSVEQIEHILIWALAPKFNNKKVYSLPGFGKNGASAWHICNGGHRFAGRMPLEIVFPWMIVRRGHDHSFRMVGE